jgi:hypothetical protein
MAKAIRGVSAIMLIRGSVRGHLLRTERKRKRLKQMVSCWEEKIKETSREKPSFYAFSLCQDATR